MAKLRGRRTTPHGPSFSVLATRDWEVIYRADASLYSAQVVRSREIADKDLAKHKEALEATGWREG
jgi:hypothetical protein